MEQMNIFDFIYEDNTFKIQKPSELLRITITESRKVADTIDQKRMCNHYGAYRYVYVGGKRP